MNPEIQRELLAFDEKIALGKLEVSKATERVSELEFQKARFLLEVFSAELKAHEQQKTETTQA